VEQSIPQSKTIGPRKIAPDEYVDMWYSKLSTGIFEVDNQHSNIDSVTILYEKDKDSAYEQKWLDMIFNSIRLHFEFEEVLFSNKMPSEHLEEHRKLTEHLKVLLGKREKQEISKLDFISSIRGLLIFHVTEFDSKFKELIE
jgi:hemerythrin